MSASIVEESEHSWPSWTVSKSLLVPVAVKVLKHLNSTYHWSWTKFRNVQNLRNDTSRLIKDLVWTIRHRDKSPQMSGEIINPSVLIILWWNLLWDRYQWHACFSSFTALISFCKILNYYWWLRMDIYQADMESACIGLTILQNLIL